MHEWVMGAIYPIQENQLERAFTRKIFHRVRNLFTEQGIWNNLSYVYKSQVYPSLGNGDPIK